MTDKDPLSIQFGLHVKSLRIKAGLTQEQLAFKANLHRTYIGMIERGEKNITLININKIVLALEISLNEFFNEWTD